MYNYSKPTAKKKTVCPVICEKKTSKRAANSELSCYRSPANNTEQHKQK